MRIRLAFLALALVLACSRTGTKKASTEPPAPPLPAVFDAAAIDAYVAAQVKTRAIVGASLAIVQAGETKLARTYGVADVETGRAVAADTAFAIGSISKQFVCVAALMLAEDGKLSLDDKVAEHYPDLTRAADITLDDLGSHMSGYPDFYPLDFLDRRMQSPIDPDDLIRRYATGPLEFEPRTRWSYSNTGFIVLGRVIEKVASRPLGEFLRARVFTPVGMTHTSFDPGADAKGLARGHISIALGAPQHARREAEGWIHAAGGVYATTEDLVRWDLALADGKLLSAESMKRLTTPRTLADGRSTDYGCGIGVRRMAGETVLSHSGAVSGFAAYNAVIPRTRSAVILLVNTEGGSPGEIHQQLLNLVVGPLTYVPDVQGPAPQDVARALFRDLQAGKLDTTRVGEELAAFLDAARLREAAPRLRALGEPTNVEVIERRGRGGMEVTTIRFTFAPGVSPNVVKALLYRTPDGIVEEFLLLHD